MSVIYCLITCRNWESSKGTSFKRLLSKHRSIACPLPLALASDLPCGICTRWTDFSRPSGWRVTTALGNLFLCRKSALRNNPLWCSLRNYKSPVGNFGGADCIWKVSVSRHGLLDTVYCSERTSTMSN